MSLKDDLMSYYLAVGLRAELITYIPENEANNITFERLIGQKKALEHVLSMLNVDVERLEMSLMNLVDELRDKMRTIMEGSQ